MMAEVRRLFRSVELHGLKMPFGRRHPFLQRLAHPHQRLAHPIELLKLVAVAPLSSPRRGRWPCYLASR